MYGVQLLIKTNIQLLELGLLVNFYNKVNLLTSKTHPCFQVCFLVLVLGHILQCPVLVPVLTKRCELGFGSKKPDLQPLVLTLKTIYIPHNIGKYVKNVPGYYVSR
jgi:hypothetical protein